MYIWVTRCSATAVIYFEIFIRYLFCKILVLFYIPIKLMNSYKHKSIHDYYKIY